MKTYWWVSWYDSNEDIRPMTDPPNENILGWWCTGSRCLDDAYTICALVRAENEEQAQAYIRQDWPEASEWRFCDRTGDAKLSDRYPLKDWMKERGCVTV